MIQSVTCGLRWDVWGEGRGRWGGAVWSYGGDAVYEVSGLPTRWDVQRRILEAIERFAARATA